MGRRNERRGGVPSLPNGCFGLVVLMSLTYVVSARFDFFERFVGFAARHEARDVDELVIVATVGLAGALALLVRWSRSARAMSRELASANEQYRSLFAYHPHGVFWMSLDGRFRAANASAERLTGWSEAELRNLDFDDLLHTDSREAVTWAFVELQDRRSQQLSITIKHRQGRLVALHFTGLPIIVGNKVIGIYGLARDVTKQNGVLRELRRANQAAERAGEAKAAFLANVSHEIRTPLTSLMTASELLADTDLDPLQEDVVETLNRAGQRLQRLVDNVLDFSKLEAGKMELEIIDLDVRALVEDAVEMFVHVADRKGVVVGLEVAAAVPRVLAGDPERICQVLNNLLGNAVKFTSTGRIDLRVTVAEADERHVDLSFSVTDTGIGMNADQRGRLFQSFTQADPSITRRYGGTGLGLVISRNLVTLMGGSIWVTSTPGQGSTFTFQVPLQHPSEDVVSPSGPALVGAARSGGAVPITQAPSRRSGAAVGAPGPLSGAAARR